MWAESEARMAVSPTLVFQTTFGNKKVKVYSIVYDSSYAGSGGEALTAGTLGFTKIQYAPPAVTTNGYVSTYDITNAKLKAWDSDYSTATDGPLQETATSNLSGETAIHCFIGY